MEHTLESLMKLSTESIRMIYNDAMGRDDRPLAHLSLTAWENCLKRDYPLSVR